MGFALAHGRCHFQAEIHPILWPQQPWRPGEGASLIWVPGEDSMKHSPHGCSNPPRFADGYGSMTQPVPAGEGRNASGQCRAWSFPSHLEWTCQLSGESRLVSTPPNHAPGRVSLPLCLFQNHPEGLSRGGGGIRHGTRPAAESSRTLSLSLPFSRMDPLTENAGWAEAGREGRTNGH